MQRFNFQFTGQRFYRINDGELGPQVRDVGCQATTTDFWGSMEAGGGPETYVLGAAVSCGTCQPGQVAAVSHGSPAALFRGVRILNTTEEAGKSAPSAPSPRTSSSTRWPVPPRIRPSPWPAPGQVPTCVGRTTPSPPTAPWMTCRSP